MGRDTVLCGPVHLISADLNLKRLSGRPDQRRVKRLVHIGFGHRDIILKPSRNRLIHLMYHAQGRIAVLDGIHDNTDGKQIIDLVQRLLLIHHFLINTEKVLCAALYLRRNPCLLYMGPHLLHKALDIIFPHALALVDLPHKIIVCVRFQIFE